MSDEIGEFSLPDYVTPGATIRWYWGEGNPNNKLVHIRAIVDDEWVVYRWWSRRKGWRYVVEWSYWFWLLDREGRATVVKHGRKPAEQ